VTAPSLLSHVAACVNGYALYREMSFLGGRMGYYSHATIPYLAPRAVGNDVLDALTGPPDWDLPGPTIFKTGAMLLVP